MQKTTLPVLAMLFVFITAGNALATDEAAPQKAEEQALPETPTVAEEMKPNKYLKHLKGSLVSNFRSLYVSHGLADSAGWVWQPSGTIEFYGVGFNIWMNMPMDKEPSQGSINEIDYTIYYTITLYNLTINPYFLVITSYGNPKSLDYSYHTNIVPSLYVSYAYGPFSVFIDLEMYAYPSPAWALRGQFGLAVNCPLPKNFGVETSAMIGINNALYNKAHLGVDQAAITYFTYDLGVYWKPWRGLKIKPNVHFSTFLPEAFLKNPGGNIPTPVLYWGGVDLSYSFN
jgi:hypothetical protein